MSQFYDKLNNNGRISFIAGPCVIESEQHAMDMAGALVEICTKYEVNFIYKSSFDKANRTSGETFRGIGFDKCQDILDAVQGAYNIEVLTDVHEQWQAKNTVADILQVPAFLCRQTDLLVACAKTGKPVNVKKGQFLSPKEMSHVCDKLYMGGCNEIIQTERGTTFGYNNLVVDMRSLEILKDNADWVPDPNALGMNMRKYWPVVFDATHSVQSPGDRFGQSGGDRDMAPVLARAATAVGIAGIFAEVHQDPDSAPSDGPNMQTLAMFDDMVNECLTIDTAIKGLRS